MEHEPADAPTAAAVTAPADRQSGTFINPVCGMAVSTSTAMHVEHFDGDDYYFCCDGCLKAFRLEPARYAAMRRAAATSAPA
jgi:P-type Cu+ transporter